MFSKILKWSHFLNYYSYHLFAPIYAIFVLHVGGTIFGAAATWAFYLLVSGVLIYALHKIEGEIRSFRLHLLVIGYFILALGIIAFTIVSRPFDIFLIQLVNAVGVSMVVSSWRTIHAGPTFEPGVQKVVLGMCALAGGIIVATLSFTHLFILLFVAQLAAGAMSLKLLQK